MKIAVAGTGYVGLSIATLLSQRNEVVALDIIPEKVEMINNRKSPIRDNEIEDYFKNKKLDLRATLDYKDAFKDAKFIIISTPTNYDDEKNFFDTSSVEDIIEKVISMGIDTTMVIKSTIPVGYVEAVKAKYGVDKCGANWNEQALKKAKSYIKISAFSYKGLIEQLEFEGFTSSEATYGVDRCGANWNEQAAKKAKSYLSISSFSRSGLIEQLEFEGFTTAQAEYGVTANGY